MHVYMYYLCFLTFSVYFLSFFLFFPLTLSITFQNRQNCVIFSTTTCSHTTLGKFRQSFMVSDGISKLGCTDLVFVDPGVKINGAYYCDVLLSKQLLPVMCDLSGEFVFQQDNTSAHWACDTV